MGNEKSFNENVLNYDRYRPSYGTDIFKDIIEYSNISSSSNIIEIGCGTGKATKPFLDINAKLIAIEIGDNLANFVKEKYKDYKNLKVENIKFEDYKTNHKVDLIFSATAFHWIPEEYAYNRCKELLVDNGVLAIFWNTPKISKENINLYNEIESIYNNYLPNKTKETYEERCNGIQYMLKEYGYKDIQLKLYKNKRIFDANSYIGLLQTYSDHMALSSEIRNELLNKIHNIILKYGKITIEDTIDLHIARKI